MSKKDWEVETPTQDEHPKEDLEAKHELLGCNIFVSKLKMFSIHLSNEKTLVVQGI